MSITHILIINVKVKRLDQCYSVQSTGLLLSLCNAKHLFHMRSQLRTALVNCGLRFMFNRGYYGSPRILFRVGCRSKRGCVPRREPEDRSKGIITHFLHFNHFCHFSSSLSFNLSSSLSFAQEFILRTA